MSATDSGTDSNNNTETGTPDTGTPDATPDGQTPVPAKIIVVHAATDYGPNHPSGVVRVCYATKTASDPDFTLSPLAPLPHSVEDGGASPFPGIPIGTGGPFPSTGLPLEGISIRPYVINAQALAQRGIIGTTGAAATARCNRLLQNGFVPDGGFPDGGEALEQNKDFWQLGDIPAGTFKNGKTYMLAIYGCTNDVDNAVGPKCGPAAGGGAFSPDGGPGPGNLKIVVLELDDTTTVSQNELGVQVVNLSPQHAAANAALPVVIPKFEPIIFEPDAGDAGIKFVSANGQQTEVPFTANPTATPMAKITGFVSNKGWFAANDTPSSLAPTTPFVPIGMNNSAATPPTIQYITEGKTAPNTAELYVNGKTYTFVLVGDPDNAATGTRKIHFLGFPNEFTPPPAN